MRYPVEPIARNADVVTNADDYYQRSDNDDATGATTTPSGNHTTAEQQQQLQQQQHADTRAQLPDEEDDGNDDDDEESDNVTVILLDHEHESAMAAAALDWMAAPQLHHPGPDVADRRRAILLRELERLQRTSCGHFGLLCAVPLVMLVVMVASVIAGQGPCDAEAATDAASQCHFEVRSFFNAFTARCICQPIPVVVRAVANVTSGTGGGGSGGGGGGR